MFKRPNTLLLTSASTLALMISSLSAPPASAQKFLDGVGIGVGIAVGKAIIDEAARAANGGRPKPSTSNNGGGSGNRSSSNSGGGSKPKEKEKEQAATEESTPRQTPQRTTAERAADARNYAAQLAEVQEIERTNRLERERNVEAAVRTFVGLLEAKHKDIRNNQQANVRVSTGVSINQVTDGEVKRALETAYKTARLFEFERLAGEIWTRDRLMVRIVNHSKRDLDDFFKGVGVKGASISDLEQMFDKRAKEVYAQALEVAELIGVSQSFDRFIRTIYEYSDRENKGLSTIGDDSHYDRLVAGMVDVIPRQTFISDDQALASDPLGLEKQFLFRFRARRALYDCMSARYAEIVSTRSGARQIEIADRSSSTRGAKLDGPANASQGNVVPASMPSVENVWDQMRASVTANCFDPVKSVVAEVKDGKIQPRTVRYDSYAGGTARQAPALTPMSNVTPSR